MAKFGDRCSSEARLRSHQGNDPLIHIKATGVEDQAVIVYSEEIRHLVAALSEAAGVLAEVWGR